MAHKPRRDRRRPSQIAGSDEAIAVGPEPLGSDLPIGLDMETAAIGEVTPEMMDEAGHKAAEAVTAMVEQAAFHATHADAEDQDESVTHPMVEAAMAEPVGSESHTSPAEPGRSAFPDVEPSPIVNDAVGTRADSAETTPHAALPSMDAIETLAPADELASAEEEAEPAAETTAAEEALVTFQDDMTPPAGLPALAAEALERTDETLRGSLPPDDPIGLINAQVIEMLASNVAATGQFLTALMGATSVTEVVAVNTHHFRRQMDLLTTQGRQLTTLARTIAFDAMKPFSASTRDHV